MTVTVPLPAGHDCHDRLHSSEKVISSRVLGAVMRNLEYIRLKIKILCEHPLLSLVFRISGKQHRETPIVQSRYNRIGVRLIAAGFHLFFGKHGLAGSENG